MGFKEIHSNKCIFIRTVDQKLIIIALYVNDILVLIKTEGLMKKIKDQIKDAFKVKDSGEIKRILDIQVHRTKDELTIGQTQYAEKVLQEYGMKHCITIATPIDDYESIQPATSNEVRADQHDYQRRIGSLMYLITDTRPDLTFVVGKLSQFCSDPTIRHMNELNRVLRYVAGTTNHDLHFKRDGGSVIYSNSVYGDDRNNRKSTYGHVLLYEHEAYI